MSSITNINNNSSVVNVGRTTPVSPGRQPASKSIPVVIAEDQSPIPVVEQNKIQSEVALSLLGIPRSEVALGIFADVNTYDVNPTEWSTSPENYVSGFGIKHVPEEAGAIVEAPRNKTAILTSKRFFRYQPGRVSAATFGVKSTVSRDSFARNPVIRKYGIYDKFDGYYWETRQSGEDDNFSVVRRSQSLFKSPATPFGNLNTQLRGLAATSSDVITITQIEDYRVAGNPGNTSTTPSTLLLKDRKILADFRYEFAREVNSQVKTAYTATNPAFGAPYTYTGNFYADFDTLLNNSETAATLEAKCLRDMDYWIDMFLLDMEAGGDAHTSFNTRNYETSLAVTNNRARFERYLYTRMKTIIDGGYSNFSEMSSAAVTKLSTLVNKVITFFTSVETTTAYPSPVSFGSKSVTETVFDTRRYYWAYYVNEFNSNGTPITYIDPGASYPYGSTSSERIAVVKDKCVRDMIYVIDGYRDDLVGGGNAATKFNASMYYNSNSSEDKLTVYSQITGGVLHEKSRHTHLIEKISDDFADSYFFGSAGTSVVSAYSAKFYDENNANSLGRIILDNFDVESTVTTEYGNKPVAGNLVVLRDGLIMVHAAVYDTSLLKPAVSIKADPDATSSTFTLTSGTVTFNQIIRYTGDDINANIVKGKLYRVKQVFGSKSNRFVIKDLDDTDTLTFTSGDISGKTISFETVVPFIFPADYDYDAYNDPVTYPDGNPYPKGMMFPYMYTSNNRLPKSETALSVGYIDTALDITLPAQANLLASQIDSVNFELEYINWIKNNVDPEYYGVYEYRVPRSRFSTDKLNGVVVDDNTPDSGNLQIYSDIAVGESGRVRPGQTVTSQGEAVYTSSVYDFDFTKVTMLKIEFSWYGAVGALFLAYVPIGNGEARWVRVHHLRASNQLKVASLGNATLPITYTVYGGGDPLSYGDEEDDVFEYSRKSHFIVKYGASYYIDGGDRGTVRLYSYDNDELAGAYGRNYLVVDGSNLGTFSSVDNSISTNVSALDDLPDNTFFMNARVKTTNRSDQNIRVIWTDANKIYLNRTPANTSVISLIPDRANTVYGVETKRQIVSSEGKRVRNRVQVYPTKLSTVNLGTDPVRLRMVKTPVFQTMTTVSGNLSLTDDYLVTSENLVLPASNTNYIADGSSIYGWFKAKIGSLQAIDIVSVFGRLYRVSDELFFELLSVYNDNVYLIDSENFLADKRFTAEGAVLTEVSKLEEEKEGLSSVKIATDSQVPVPGTGRTVATLYMNPGTEQIDLNTYYDYNKEYLSFPLTDIADTLYFVVDAEAQVNILQISPEAQVGIGVTWEEQ